MDEKCSLCGGEMLEGNLFSTHGVFFYLEGEEKKLVNQKKSALKAFCCKECGNIQIKAAELDKLK